MWWRAAADVAELGQVEMRWSSSCVHWPGLERKGHILMTETSLKFQYFWRHMLESNCWRCWIRPICADANILPTVGGLFVQAVSKLDEFINQMKNPVQDRHEFRLMTEHVGEKMKDYVKLRAKARECVFVDAEREIQEQMIAGISNGKKAILNKIASNQDMIKEATLDETLTKQSKPGSSTTSSLNYVDEGSGRFEERERDKKWPKCYCSHDFKHFARNCEEKIHRKSSYKRGFHCGGYNYDIKTCKSHPRSLRNVHRGSSNLVDDYKSQPMEGYTLQG